MSVWENSRNSVGPGVGLEDAQLGVSDPNSCAEMELGCPTGWQSLLPGAFLDPSGAGESLSVSTQVWAGLLLKKRRSRWKGGVRWKCTMS